MLVASRREPRGTNRVLYTPPGPSVTNETAIKLSANIEIPEAISLFALDLMNLITK
ncbi:MAG: hypothetical protein IH984_13990 [Planctomycetes bacterium]|nr:hypothetical protein [Planctomycetota bacterium]